MKLKAFYEHLDIVVLKNWNKIDIRYAFYLLKKSQHK